MPFQDSNGMHFSNGANFHSPTSVLQGAPTQNYTDQIKQIMMERLAKTSRSKIHTAVSKHWLPYREQYNLPVFVPPGSASRGGEMATFAIILAGKLSYGTVQGYIWSITEFHKQQLGVHGNPLDGVADWSRFMNALMVQTWVDTKVESHVMVPFPVLLRTLLSINQKIQTRGRLGPDDAHNALHDVQVPDTTAKDKNDIRCHHAFAQTRRRVEVFVRWGLLARGDGHC